MVETKPAYDAGQPVFRALLTPHRSLSPKGFALLMAVLFCVSLASGLFFLSLGAWPVVGFFGLDVLLLYGAFRLNYRAARFRCSAEGGSFRLDRVWVVGDLDPSWVRPKDEAYRKQAAGG